MQAPPNVLHDSNQLDSLESTIVKVLESFSLFTFSAESSLREESTRRSCSHIFHAVVEFIYKLDKYGGISHYTSTESIASVEHEEV